MADAQTSSKRPLSPHLQVYRPQITSILSIFHRLTGVVNAFGLVFLAWWLVAAAVGGEYFAWVQWFYGTWIGMLMLIGWTWTNFYHLCNGVRHLVWDAGYGFEIDTLTKSGLVMLVVSAGLTAVAWAAALLV